MESMRESWTDERLDDLNARVESGFGRLDTEMRALRVEMKAGFDRIDARMERMEERMDARLDALQRLMIQFCGLMLAAVIGLTATQL